jgi:hypothetical protein
MRGGVEVDIIAVGRVPIVLVGWLGVEALL